MLPQRLAPYIRVWHRILLQRCRLRWYSASSVSSFDDTSHNNNKSKIFDTCSKLLQIQAMDSPFKKSETAELISKITEQPHSVHLRWLPAKVCLYSHHQHHHVVVTCLTEKCAVETVHKPFDWPSTGQVHKLEAGKSYALTDHQPHYLHGPEDGASARLLCVVSPPLVDSVEQDASGSFQLTPSEDWFP